MYPLSEIQSKLPDYYWLIKYNPLAQVIESFRYMTLSEGYLSWPALLGSLAAAVICFIAGLLVFNKTEQSFIDTV
jgi:lipopolysaccharide transport system permease protein